MFGNYINEKALDILQYAPLLMLLFGYWKLSNRQIFFNEVSLLENKNDVLKSNHAPLNFDKGADFTILILVNIPILYFFERCMNIVRRIFNFFDLAKKLSGMDNDWNIVKSINEGLGNYWECLTG